MFSALAGSDTTYEEKTQQFKGHRILKSAVIYGANGSGKSNFIDAVNFVKMLVINSINYQPGQGMRDKQKYLKETTRISQQVASLEVSCLLVKMY